MLIGVLGPLEERHRLYTGMLGSLVMKQERCSLGEAVLTDIVCVNRAVCTACFFHNKFSL